MNTDRHAICLLSDAVQMKKHRRNAAHEADQVSQKLLARLLTN